jgi:hypothetical protein
MGRSLPTSPFSMRAGQSGGAELGSGCSEPRRWSSEHLNRKSEFRHCCSELRCRRSKPRCRSSELRMPEHRASKSELGASMPRLGASTPEPGASKSNICAPLDGTQAPIKHRPARIRRLGFTAAVVRPLTVPSAPSRLVLFAPRAPDRIGQVAPSRDELEEAADKLIGRRMGRVSRVPGFGAQPRSDRRRRPSFCEDTRTPSTFLLGGGLSGGLLARNVRKITRCIRMGAIRPPPSRCDGRPMRRGGIGGQCPCLDTDNVRLLTVRNR